MHDKQAIADYLRKIALLPVPDDFGEYVDAQVARGREPELSDEDRTRIDALVGLRDELPKLKALAQEMLDKFYS